MKVMRPAGIAKEPATNPIFTGGLVTHQLLLGKERKGNFYVSMVNFSKGARNKFHSHTCDQVLIVTSGRGIVATEKEQVTVGKGEIIHIPAGEKHWHGATKDSEFSHLAILTADNEMTPLED